MWGFNRSIDEVWVPDPVLFLNAEIIYFNQRKNLKKKENKKRKQQLKALKANESNLYDSQFQIVNDTLNAEDFDEEISQFDPSDSERDESLTFNSVLGDIQFENKTQQNSQKFKEQQNTNIGKSLFSQKGLQSLKNKGALQVSKSGTAQNSFVTQNGKSVSVSFSNNTQKSTFKDIGSQNNYDCIVKALHLENKNQKFEELKKIFQNNGGINDIVQAQNKNAEQTISASKSLLNDKVLFDLKISLVQKPKDRLLITITDQQDLQTFLRQIKEVMEQNYQIFNGLTGFKVKTLEIDYLAAKNDQRAKYFQNIQQTDKFQSFHKIGRTDDYKLNSTQGYICKNDDQNQLPPNVLNEQLQITQEIKANLLQKVVDRSSALLTKKQQRSLQEEIKYNLKIDINNKIQQEEIVKKFLRKNDRCFVRMESQDLWLDIDMLIEAQPHKFQSNFQMKVDMDMTGKQLKKVIQKMSISIWNQIASENNVSDYQKYNQIDSLKLNLIQYQNLFLRKERGESFTLNDEQQIFNQMIEQVHQLLKGDHLFVLTGIEITKQKILKHPKLVQGSQISNYKKLANQQYRALVAQEREQSKHKGNTSFMTNMDEQWIEEGENSQSFYHKYNSELIETEKEEDDEIVNIQIDDYQEIGSQFDYDRNKVRVVCNFQAIIDYFETYVKMINQKIKNIDALPTINQSIEVQQSFINQEKKIKVDDENEQTESQAFKILNLNQDQSNNYLALKPCNDEEIFLWNLANISSSKIELLLKTKNQQFKVQKQSSSFLQNNEQNTIRSQYIQTLKTKDLFNNLILQKGQVQDNQFKQNSASFTLKNTKIQTKRKSHFQDLFSSKIKSSNNIRYDSVSDFDSFNSSITSSNKTQQIKDVNNLLTLTQNSQIKKSQVEKQDIKRSQTVSQDQIREILIGGIKQSFYESTQKQKQQKINQKQFDDNFQLEAYNPLPVENTSDFSEESVKQEQDHLSKRFMLQNKALNFILLQSKREISNAQLFQRHLLLKNAIHLMNKTQNSTNFNAFKAIEMVIDHINPQNHFQINKSHSNTSIDNHRNPSQSVILQNNSFNTNDKRLSHQHSITSKLDLGSQGSINQTNQKLIGFQKSILEEEFESSSSSSSEKEQVRDYDCSDEDNKQTEQDQNEIQEEQKQKINNRFDSTLQKFDNEPELSRAETIIGFTDRKDTISKTLYSRSNTIMFNVQNQRNQSEFHKSNYIKETEEDLKRNESQFIEQNLRKGTVMNLGRQQSYISKFGGSDKSQYTQMQLIGQDSEVIQIKKDDNSSDTEINFGERKNSIKPLKSEQNFQARKTEKLNIEEEDFTAQFKQNISKNSKKNQTKSLRLDYQQNTLKKNKLQSINETNVSIEDNSKVEYLIESQNEVTNNSDQKKDNFNNFSSTKLGLSQKFKKLFEGWGPQGKKSLNDKSGKSNNVPSFILHQNYQQKSERQNEYNKSDKKLRKTPQTNIQQTRRSQQKSNRQSLQEICSICGFEQPPETGCPNCKGDTKKNFYNYFMKDRMKNDDGITIRTYLNANKLFDLPSVSFVKQDSLQVAINEGINNTKSYQTVDKVAQDLVKKAIFIGGGGSIQELSEMPIKSISNTKDFPKYNQAQQLTMFGFQMQLAMLVPLPDCLLTYEEYLQIKEPMIINLEYHEVKGKLHKDDAQDVVLNRESKRYWLRNYGLKIQILIVAIFVAIVLLIAIIIAVYLTKIFQ